MNSKRRKARKRLVEGEMSTRLFVAEGHIRDAQTRANQKDWASVRDHVLKAKAMLGRVSLDAAEIQRLEKGPDDEWDTQA